MSRFRKFAYLAVTILIVLAVFTVDVIRSTVDLENVTLEFLREGSIVLVFVLLYLVFRYARSQRKETPPREIGKLLAAALVLIAFAIGGSFLPSIQFIELNHHEVPANVLTTLTITIISIALGAHSILTLLFVKDLILHKRKKGTKRNFMLFIGSMIISVLLLFPFLAALGNIVGSIAYGLTILLIIVNSFRQNWIVYLSRREKVYILIYAALSVFAFIVLLAFVSESGFVEKGLTFFSVPLERFVKINLLLGTIYFGMAFVSTLFHLPTADVYEKKQIELDSLHSLSRLVAQVLDFPDLVKTVTQMTREVCGAKSSWLELIRNVDGSRNAVFEVVATNNMSRYDIDLLMGDHESDLRQLVLESKKVLLIDSVGKSVV